MPPVGAVLSAKEKTAKNLLSEPSESADSGEASMEYDIDLDEMTLDELRELLAAFKERLARMDDEEPVDADSDIYDQWAEAHEDMEDIIDDITDRIELLAG